MSIVEKFGEIRGLLERPPSCSVFDLMIQRVEDAAGADQAQVLETWMPYIESKLQLWPDETRLCPKHRHEEYESGKPIWCHLVRALDYERESLGPKRLDKILAAPHLKEVTALDLRGSRLKWPQIKKLAKEAPCRLKSFGFQRGSTIDWDILDTLFSSPMLSGVEHLNFSNWDTIKADVYLHLLELFPLENLRTLDVSGGAISARKVKELVQTGRLNQLEEFRAALWVSHSKTKGMLQVFAKHKQMQNLRVLELEEVSDRDLKSLSGAAHLSSLRELNIWHPLSAQSVEQLLLCPHLSGVESLTLALEPSAWGACVSALNNAPAKGNLRSLKLFGDKDESTAEMQGVSQSFTSLLQGGHLQNLTRLGVPFEPALWNAFIDHAEQLPKLQELMVISGQGDPKSVKSTVERLTHKPHFSKLDTLSVYVPRSEQAIHPVNLLIHALKDSEFMRQIQQFKAPEEIKEALKDLLTSTGVSGLRRLSLPDEGMFSALTSAEHLSSMEAILFDVGFRVDDFLAHRSSVSNHLPEVLHVGFMECSSRQGLEWMP